MTMLICPVCSVKFNSDFYASCPVEHAPKPSLAKSVDLVTEAQVGITAPQNTLVKFCAICGAARKYAESKFCGDCGSSFEYVSPRDDSQARPEHSFAISSERSAAWGNADRALPEARFTSSASINASSKPFPGAALGLGALVVIVGIILGALNFNEIFNQKSVQKTVESSLMEIQYVNFYEEPPVPGNNTVHDYYCRENHGTHVMTFTSKSDAEMVIRLSPLVPYAMGQLGDEWWVARWKYSDECRAAIAEALQ
jgi:hypothetical protein